jgi:DNA-binding protein H-NS
MSKDAVKVLLNIRSLRAVAREMTLEQLKEALDKLSTVYDERSVLEAEQAAKEAERREKLDKYRKMLEADGIDIAEIVSGSPSVKQKKERSKKPPKYEYLTESGEVKYWTGQGRTPKAIQAELDNGKSLDDFLIDSNADRMTGDLPSEIS